ncbi:Crp/Fnr family transcriptional regulator [Paracoccus luteus]|uniref:Crp/Fnr family transcriptional regulator n=1 Tax=Paracoccus luteus TaxID=2508543 RepID=UPI0014311A5F|nr:Crp/Fnr family transcriptional regulator [Paracoccus luteus]
MTLSQAWPDVLTSAEAQFLSDLQGGPQAFRPRQPIMRCEQPVESALYLCSGFAGRYRSDKTGRRQLLALQVPGDYIDLPGFVLGHLDHDLDALGPVVVRGTPHDRLQMLYGQAPELVHKLWRISLIDASIHRYWIFRIGRLAGRARIANFFCEMLLRLYARGLCDFHAFQLPLAQVDLAEACGMTPVHANRMLAELRDEGICTFADGSVQIGKLPKLFQIGQYSWNYLYLAPDLDAEIRGRVIGPGRPAAGALSAATSAA